MSKLILNGGSLEVEDTTINLMRVSGGGVVQVGDGTFPTTVTVTSLDTYTAGEVAIESGATLDVTQNISLLTGSIEIGAGGKLIVGGEADLAPGSHLDFAGTGATLELGPNSDLTGNPGEAEITNFGVGDTILFDGITTDNSTYNATNHLLTLRDGASVVDRITISGPGVTALDLIHNVDGTTSIVLCYAAGTMILTERGERAIEEIRIGDPVITLTGAAKPVKWVGHRSYRQIVEGTGRAAAPILIRAGALAEHLPLRDLRVSPQHALYLDGALIDASMLVNGVTIVQEPMPDAITYYNLEFDAHEVIYAEGVAAESFAERNCRMIFDNAGEFRALYPNEPMTMMEYAAPRPADGPLVEAVRRRLDARAGLQAMPRGRYILGQIEHAAHDRISGWAHDPASPRATVTLSLTIDGIAQGEVVANRYRSDLAEVGYGTGQCGFRILLAEPLAPDMRHVITLHRRDDGVELPSSPFLIERVPQLDEALPPLLSAGFDDADADATIDHLIEQVSRLLQARSDVLGTRDDRGARWSKLDGQPLEDVSREMPAVDATGRDRRQDAA
jgi:hypothetical protein